MIKVEFYFLCFQSSRQIIITINTYSYVVWQHFGKARCVTMRHGRKGIAPTPEQTQESNTNCQSVNLYREE